MRLSSLFAIAFSVVSCTSGGGDRTVPTSGQEPPRSGASGSSDETPATGSGAGSNEQAAADAGTQQAPATGIHIVFGAEEWQLGDQPNGWMASPTSLSIESEGTAVSGELRRITIEVNATTPGNYDFGPDGLAKLHYDDGETTFKATSGSVTLEKVGALGKLIEGTFTGFFAYESGVQKKPAPTFVGSFKVTHVKPQ